MIVLAHIMAMPVEEVLVPLASGAGAGTMVWLAALLRRAAQDLSAADFLKRRGNVRLDADKGEGVEPLG